ncbi:MAG: DUF6602 domain-containing protein [Asgard group archaeon]
MNDLLQDYFENLEQYFINSVNLAGKSASKTATTERAAGAEDFVAKILESHLPTRASVATHRQIIGADQEPSGSVDVIVYNEWTTMLNLLNQGFILAESVYLALEVKAADDKSTLKGSIYTNDKGKKRATGIMRAVGEQLPRTRVKKSLRPETIYFGNIRKSGELPFMSTRLFTPTNGVIGFLWGNSGETLNAKECLECVEKGISECEEIADKRSPLNWPNVIYVPQQFLAFMVCEKAIKSDDTPEPLPVLKNEYPFLINSETWSPDTPITFQYDEVPEYKWKGLQFQYRYLEDDSELNLLYVFIFWLCQEILKFALEIPDYHRYLLPLEQLDGREGAQITKDGCWHIAKFNKNKDEWEQVQ